MLILHLAGDSPLELQISNFSIQQTLVPNIEIIFLLETLIMAIYTTLMLMVIVSGLTFDQTLYSSADKLTDFVADNTNETSAITFGTNFGRITDIETGPDGFCIYCLTGRGKYIGLCLRKHLIFPLI